MKKNKKLIIWLSVGLVVILLVTWLMVRSSNKQSGSDTSGSGTSGTGGTGSSTSSTSSVFPLHYGSRGNEVKALQTYLNAHLTVLAPLVIDGIWGPKTAAAVERVLGTDQVTAGWYNANIG